MAAKGVRFSHDGHENAAWRRRLGECREGPTWREGPPCNPRQSVRRASNNQGRRDRREAYRAAGQVREHGGADGPPSRFHLHLRELFRTGRWSLLIDAAVPALCVIVGQPAFHRFGNGYMSRFVSVGEASLLDGPPTGGPLKSFATSGGHWRFNEISINASRLPGWSSGERRTPRRRRDKNRAAWSGDGLSRELSLSVGAMAGAGNRRGPLPRLAAPHGEPARNCRRSTRLRSQPACDPRGASFR